MKRVEFTSDFGGHKKGGRFSFDNMLAAHLVHTDKVAKYVDDASEKEVNKPTTKKEPVKTATAKSVGKKATSKA